MAKNPALKRWAIVRLTPMPLPRGIQDARPGGTHTSSPDGASDLSKHFLTGMLVMPLLAERMVESLGRNL